MPKPDGLSWLALSHGDRRRLRQAAHHFVRTKDWHRAKDVLRIAEEFGDLRCVLLLREASRRFNIHELQTTNLALWLKHALRWFDIYHDHEAGVYFVRPEDQRLFNRIVNEVTSSSANFWAAVNEAAQADNTYPLRRRKLLALMAAGKPAIITDEQNDQLDDIEEKFNQHCREHGLKILKQLQAGRRGTGLCSYVWLVQDSDGLVKIFKEVVCREQIPLNYLQLSEDSLLYKLRHLSNIPRCYGRTAVQDGPSFLRLSTEYGQTLAELLEHGPLTPPEVRSIIRQLAEVLTELHKHHLIYRDLRPQNVKVRDGLVTLLDLGDAVEFPTPGHSSKEAVFAPMADSKFAPPEVTLGYRLWPKSDVFQLGVLAHLLATGVHPFERAEAINADQFTDERDREIMEFALPMACETYDDRALRVRDAELADLVCRLLVKEPDERPTMSEVAAELQQTQTSQHVTIKHRPRHFSVGPERNTVLFPARMGIPHRGHIDFLARLLELDFHIIISLQHSYCNTIFDPYPKWMVLKMVAQSLLKLGFSPDRFSFLLTPTYETLNERRLHFTLMPGREHVVAVASGNPDVWDLFPELPILDQAAVFGHERQEYETRSWGSILRQAIRDDDYQTFLEYAANGVEEIMSFEELRRRYAETPVKFVEGRIIVKLTTDTQTLLATTRVTRYETPETALIRALRASGHSVALVDPYARDSVLELDGKSRRLHYQQTRLVDGDAEIDFVLY
jgi:serine/threonine protein kinase